ncbi:hypothetical protein B0T16DRAFT_140391 [Cercophora newfieldiana]|uniref:Uncharacterized protein n=1 Tax=Cercophora newfieldiana TaxID=92897 RepID=A0AA39Y3Q8_9PEZI|nr:hypothetical protein B0T16DRAFT_140391 [Cercophora newfieldiana]
MTAIERCLFDVETPPSRHPACVLPARRRRTNSGGRNGQGNKRSEGQRSGAEGLSLSCCSPHFGAAGLTARFAEPITARRRRPPTRKNSSSIWLSRGRGRRRQPHRYPHRIGPGWPTPHLFCRAPRATHGRSECRCSLPSARDRLACGLAGGARTIIRSSCCHRIRSSGDQSPVAATSPASRVPSAGRMLRVPNKSLCSRVARVTSKGISFGQDDVPIATCCCATCLA